MIAIANKYVTAYRVTMLIAVILIIVGIPISIHFLQPDPTLPQAVTAYEFPLIETNKTPLCPGEKVIYDQVARIDHTPAAILVVETVWSIDQGKTVLPDYHPFYVNIPKSYTGRGHTEWLVPDLPTGHYELRRSTTAQGRQTEMFVVTFEVKSGCK